MTAIEHTVIAYSSRGGQSATRPAWIVEPPGHQSLVVVLESRHHGGLSIQNGAESIALAVRRHFPDHVTVLHYPDAGTAEDPSAFEDWWAPVPIVDGVPNFGHGLGDFPDVEASLKAAGLR